MVREGRRTMSSARIALPIFTALVLVAGGVHAEALYPIQGKAIDLGTFEGTVYYTIQPDGYRVVVTLQNRVTCSLHCDVINGTVHHPLHPARARGARDAGAHHAPW